MNNGTILAASIGEGRGGRALAFAKRSAALAATTATCLAAISLLAAERVDAAIPSIFGGAVPCEVKTDGTRHCGNGNSTVPTFDGTPIDVSAAFPPAPTSGPDGNYPMVMIFHGWGGSEAGLSSLQRWTDLGYAAFSMSDRGWGNSCGGTSPSRFTPACINGYNHLMDTRYEVRDAQVFAGLLADENLINPTKIGATGGSYGGGLSMSLAALKNRVMQPDGTLVPWTSPSGKPMEIAAAAPEIPWTDLAYSLAPTGFNLDYVEDSPYTRPGASLRTGVLKTSFVAGLYGTGKATSNYAITGTDDDADLDKWYTFTNAGEPYDANPLAADVLEELTTSGHHSNYYIDHSQAPAPLFISNGWTDDLFPADEAIRFYNRTRAEYPGADISLMFLDYGHQRGQGKGVDTAKLRAQQEAWFDFHIRGNGSVENEVTALTQTCPNGAASAGPFTAPSWRELSPGEVRLADPASKIIAPAGGDPAIGRAFDPIGGDGACATTSAADQPGTATYRTAAAPAGGFTILGSPTVIADILSAGPNNQVSARLLDVDPGGNQTLIARGVYRPDFGSTSATRQVFQLHPNAYKIAEGHIVKLELIANDAPYSRPSNGQTVVNVSNLELRLPTKDAPDGGQIEEPAPKILPVGYDLAEGYGTPDTDGDGDGVLDADDDCPTVQGPAENNGCPLPDADSDGVPDVDDDCPADPGPVSNGGCPEVDPPDADSDGVPDVDDACPNDPGPADNAGCPLPLDDDADDDGVPDDEDACPNEVGPIDNGGCPVVLDDDADDDGVLDVNDDCPEVPGSADNAGCPIPDPCTELIEGTNGSDELSGTRFSDLIVGHGSRDVINGRKGDDCLRGQNGNDDVFGGLGMDLVRGGSGIDHLFGQAGDDQVSGQGGDDVIKPGSGKDIAAGGKGNDTIKARDGERDEVNCGAGRHDVAVVDKRDRVKGCETVRRRSSKR